MDSELAEILKGAAASTFIAIGTLMFLAGAAGWAAGMLSLTPFAPEQLMLMFVGGTLAGAGRLVPR
jgi:hypothetical protein